VSEEPRSKRDQQRLAAILLIILVGLIAGSAVFINRSQDPAKAPVVTVKPPQISKISITDQGFSPATITVPRNTIVIWQAVSNNKPVIIASNPYPTNDDLKDLKSTQLGPGASYRYQFKNSGTYNYHDDLDPTVNGTIIVE
jgi:plastocyanin